MMLTGLMNLSGTVASMLPHNLIEDGEEAYISVFLQKIRGGVLKIEPKASCLFNTCYAT
jgi:hypothetical protein